MECTIPFKEDDKFHLCVILSIRYLKLQMKRICFIFASFYTYNTPFGVDTWLIHTDSSFIFYISPPCAKRLNTLDTLS